MISPTAEDYLQTAYRLEEKKGAVVPLSDLADHLGLSIVSVNQMVRRLDEQGLLHYTPYRGVTLSDEGRACAAGLVRRHRLWERFLADVLDIPWELIHEEACRLEHATSPLVEERLAGFLGEPGTCPHGHPVPNEEGEILREEGDALAQTEPGQEVLVLSVPEQEPALLRYLAELGLSPGTRVHVDETAPFAGVLTIQVGGVRHVVGQEVAEQIRVQIIPTSKRG